MRRKKDIYPIILRYNTCLSFLTKSKYLSKIVNTYRTKPFVHYINDLGIEYAIENWTNILNLLKYTIQALALEFGFNSAES